MFATMRQDQQPLIVRNLSIARMDIVNSEFQQLTRYELVLKELLRRQKPLRIRCLHLSDLAQRA